MKIVGILGNGWLGKALKDYWSTQFPDLLVHTFNRSSQTDSITFNLAEEVLPPSELKECQFLYVLLPPGRDLDAYLSSLNQLTKIYANVNKIVFVSTTSVFAEDQGHCDENTMPANTSPRATKLLEAETIIMKAFSTVTIIRSAGQIGPNRYPALSLARKSVLPAGNTPVNVIHLDDLVRILTLPLTQNTPKLIHAVSPLHPLKRDFYSKQALDLGFKLGEFPNGELKEKCVDSLYLKEINYQFVNKSCDIF
jgi:hypothetical protein